MAINPGASLFKRNLRRLDLTLFSVCAILVLDGLGASASIGAASLTWYLVTLVLFFIPYGLIIAELGTAYPGQGGIYVWIGRAFGPRSAARATWCYWVCVPLGIPSVYVLFAGILSQLFLPSTGTSGDRPDRHPADLGHDGGGIDPVGACRRIQTWGP